MKGLVNPPRKLAELVGAGELERVEHLRCVEGRTVAVSLYFSQGDRRLGQRSGLPAHRVPRILPTLVGKAEAGAVDVFHQAIAIGIAVFDEPATCRLQRRQ